MITLLVERERAALLFGSIVDNRAIEYKRQNVLKVVVHVIFIDQCNQSAP